MKDRQKRYRKTDKGKNAHRQAQNRYRESDKGKTAQQIAQWRWRAKHQPTAEALRFAEYVRQATPCTYLNPEYRPHLQGFSRLPYLVICFRGGHYLEFADLPDQLCFVGDCTCKKLAH